MAAVLVHIDLDGDRPNASSLQALAAGRAIASSWGATLYAAVIARSSGKPSWPAGAPPKIPGDPRTVEAIRLAIVRAGADKIVVALTDVAIAPLWSVLGTAWQGVLDHLRPRLVLFGADAPSAIELGPRTGARIGARLFLRARVLGRDELELRDRDGGYVRIADGGAAVILVGAGPRIEVHANADDDIDVMVLELPGGADPRIELASSAPAELAHIAGPVIAIGDEAASDPEVAKATQRLAKVMGAHIVGSAQAAIAGVVGPGAVIERGAPIIPELCVTIGAPAIDVAGSTSMVRIGATSGSGKGADGALSGPIAVSLGELARALEGR